MNNKFTHLHLHTHYSLLDGLTNPQKLIDRVKELGMDSVAVTEHGNMYSAIEFYKAAKAGGIKPIIGCEVYICDDMTQKSVKKRGIDLKEIGLKTSRDYYHLTLLVKDLIGYNNLIQLVSKANLNGFYYKPRIDFNLLKQHSEGLIVLSGCLSGQLSQLLLQDKFDEAYKLALDYKGLFGDRYYIELQRHENIPDQNKVTPLLIELANKLNIPPAATGDSHYLCKEDAKTHDVLLAVQTGKLISDENRMTMIKDDFSVSLPDEMYEKFSDIPEAVSNTQLIADSCELEIELNKIRLPRFELPKGWNDYNEYLEYLCKLKLDEVYEDTIEAEKRLTYELEVIKVSGFASYMLIVGDIIQWAKSKGIAVGPGRGSAAGSIISYILGITSIDPLKYGLLFERFMNPARISMPDIDMDFEDTRRDEVINYVKGKYGSDYVEQIITFGTMASRSSLRDVARALGFDLAKVDRIAKLIPFQMDIAKALEEVNELKDIYSDPESKIIIDMAINLEGVIRHVATHACGVVIADKPITDYMPIQRSTSGEGTMSQYDMGAIESLGLLKMDFLGLRNLSVIAECSHLVKEQLNYDLDINKIPLDDKATYKLLQMAKTTSVFQLESDGMKRYLKELMPTELGDITVMVSLYRPGPMELIPEYIARKHGYKKVEYLYPSLEPVLKDTYGIMIYQEQLIKAVQVLAGFTLAEADVLRKAVGKKIKKLLDEQEEGFKKGCERVGTPKDIADKFWSLVEPFNRYAFNLSHAVSYAMIAYQTAYLKANYPLQFLIAEMNSDESIERITELVRELKDIGIKITPPHINFSGNKFTGAKNIIRFSTSAIKGMNTKIADQILQIRDSGFQSLQDFAIRSTSIGLNKKVVELLGKVGAFDELEDRNNIVEAADIIVSYTKCDEPELLPPLVLEKQIPVTTNQKLSWEKELLGLYVSANPVDGFYEDIKKFDVTDISNVLDHTSQYTKIGGIITDFKKKVTRAGKIMYIVRIQDWSESFEFLLFNGIYNKDPEAFKVNNIVILNGKVSQRNEKNIFSCTGARIIGKLG